LRECFKLPSAYAPPPRIRPPASLFRRSRMLAFSSAPMAFAPVVAPGAAVAPRASVSMETVSDLKSLATQLNPAVGFWDPLKLAEAEFWDNTNEETIGWLRHAEIKHGRVAMAAFVGYIVQANGIHFPWNLANGVSYADISAAGSPPEQWDAMSSEGKWQIILGVGFLEWWSELRLAPGEPHYMKGGKPGYYPPFEGMADELPHVMPFNLYDPFNWHKNMTPEQKAKGLLTEINNGRLAMLGIFGFLSESAIPGAVPFLKGVIPAYAGDPMVPF